jgi:8-oxo-dGTP pyrophosphatase MutT (NUDIX family)
MGRRAIPKVTAFITRHKDGRPELLLFRHPTAGIQVPAGTVEIGEPVEAAARREAREESGLAGLELIRELGSALTTLPDDMRAVARPTKLFDEPAFDASTTGFHCNRGTYLRVLRPAGPFVEVVYEEAELGSDPPVVHVLATGFVRESVLARQLERHFFHFVCRQPTAESWPVETDNRTFCLFWTPLAPELNLMPPQDEWLRSFYEPLVRSAAALLPRD